MSSAQHAIPLPWCSWCACYLSSQQDVSRLRFVFLMIQSIDKIDDTDRYEKSDRTQALSASPLVPSSLEWIAKNALSKIQPLSLRLSMVPESNPPQNGCIHPSGLDFDELSLKINGVRRSPLALGGGPCGNITITNFTSFVGNHFPPRILPVPDTIHRRPTTNPQPLPKTHEAGGTAVCQVVASSLH